MRGAIVLSLLAGLAASQNIDLNQAIADNVDLSGLSELLNQATGVLDSLASVTDITVLAPNTAAIEALGTLGTADALTNLMDILSYHVINGTFRSTDFTATPRFAATLLTDAEETTVTGGQVVKVAVQDGTVRVNDNANVVTADIEFAGGVIHIIDQVLEIPGSVEDALRDAGLTGDAIDLLADQVADASDVTVFAPTNAAFDAISDNIAALSDDEVTNVVRYHAVVGTVAYSPTINNGTSLQTLQGSSITAMVNDTGVWINGAQVTTADILTSSGVLHVIDTVLLPGSGNATNGGNGGDPTQTGAATPSPTNSAMSGTPSKFITLAAGFLTFAMILSNL